MRRLLLLSMVVLMLGVVGLGVACGSKTDEDQIKDVINGVASAWNSKDWDEFISYTADISGTDAELEYTKTMILAPMREAEGTWTIEKIEDITVSGTTATAKVTSKMSSGTVTMTATFKKVDDDWKVNSSSLQ